MIPSWMPTGCPRAFQGFSVWPCSSCKGSAECRYFSYGALVSGSRVSFCFGDLCAGCEEEDIVPCEDCYYSGVLDVEKLAWFNNVGHRVG